MANKVWAINSNWQKYSFHENTKQQRHNTQHYVAEISARHIQAPWLLPHPAGRVRKQGFQIRQSKFFKLNYFIKEYERSSYGHEENQEINF
jgi:hypothetical protein